MDIKSPRDFIRALKAQPDPPSPGQPVKIEIARWAWNNRTLYVPSKGEVISEWILTKLLKDKAKESELNPLLDVRYWTLLSDIISPTECLPSARPSKKWLLPLLTRLPVAPTIIAFVDLLSSIEWERRNHLTSSVFGCLVTIWPLGIPKFSSDALSECFGAILRVVDLCAADENLARIGGLIASSFKDYQANTSNSKKILTMFLENHLQTWMKCVITQDKSNGPFCNLLDHINMIGIEALFCLDNLRRIRDPSFINLIFDKLEEETLTSPSLSLGVLPHIFSSYIQRLRQHRSALYAQSSNRDTTPCEALLVDSMSLFVMCNALVDKATFVEEAWSARLALLSVVEKENLFSAVQRNAEQSLAQVGRLAIDSLSVPKPDCIDRIRLAIEILCTLFRIDFDILSQAVPYILPKLLPAVKFNSSAISFLNILVNYHSKTRTLPIYIQNLLTSLFFPSLCLENQQNLYHAASSGPLLHASHLDKLGKSIQMTLTPSQVPEVVQIIAQTLQGSWSKLPTSLKSKEDVSVKRRHSVVHDGPIDVPNALSAISFALQTKVACVILPLLPIQSVLKSAERDIQGVVDDMRTSLIHLPLRHVLRIIRKRNSRDEWAAQIIAVAALSLWYTLDGTRFLIPRLFDPKCVENLLEASEDSGIVSELGLQIFRSLLRCCERRYTDISERVLTNLLDYLEEHLSLLDESQVDYPKQVGQEEDQRNSVAAALFYMTIQRWLPMIDAIATEHHLERLVKMLVGFSFRGLHIPSVSQIRGKACLAETLCSALFWELSNLRNVLIAHLDSATLTLDGIDARNCSALQRGAIPNQLQQLEDAIAVFGFTMLIPPNYLTKSCRADLLRRALVADIVISSLPIDNQDAASFISRFDRTVKSKPNLTEGSPTSHPAAPSVSEYLEHILNENGQLTMEYTSSTLHLVDGCLSVLLKDKTNVQELLRICDSFTQMDLTTPAHVKQAGLMHFIKLMTSSFSRSDLSDGVLSSMLTLQDHLYTLLVIRLSEITAEDTPALLLRQEDLLDAWCHVLSLRRWLRVDKHVMHQFGQTLMAKILNIPHTAATDQALVNMSVATLAILIEELHTLDAAERMLQLDVIVAAYIALYGITGTDGRNKLDGLLTEAGKQFSVPEFSHILGFILESLSNPIHHESHLAPLIRLMSLLCHAAPEGTMRIIQRTTTQGLNIFANYDQFIRKLQALRHPVLHLIGKLTSDRPAALQLIDLGSIWSLLFRLLVGSQEHEHETSTATFHDIIAIVNSLVRLRRDLVVSTLPHLVMILRQLITSMRQPRPQLGAKQSKLVADSFPQWINPGFPLTPEEGKALARLLASLTMKTVVKSHTSFTDTQKAESLAKPFSKHAMFVLKTYIDIMIDPLCVVPLEIRRAIQPGLFSLCDMLNEHTRDALMVSIASADGKATLKLLWKEYEKQRYIGMG